MWAYSIYVPTIALQCPYQYIMNMGRVNFRPHDDMNLWACNFDPPSGYSRYDSCSHYKDQSQCWLKYNREGWYETIREWEDEI